MRTYIQTCIHTNIQSNIHTRLQRNMNAHMPAHMKTCVTRNNHTDINICMLAFIITYLHTHALHSADAGLVLPGPRVIGSSFELEARLGSWLYEGPNQMRGRFDNGVSREFMDRVLALCEGWADWRAVGG